MEKILALIQEKQDIYAESPLFEFMQDSTIHPVKRLAFAPCAAPFIMNFADLCKYTLRREPPTNVIQALLNQHTYEDDFHWEWFLEDLQQLGFNHLLNFNDLLEFLWSEETRSSRFLSNEIYHCIVQSNALEKWIILEVMEATADVFLSHTRTITQEIQLLTKQEFKYFGNCHLNAETDHTTHSQDVSELIESIRISQADEHRGTMLINRIFELFSQWNLSLLAYAQDYQVSQLLRSQPEQEEFNVA